MAKSEQSDREIAELLDELREKTNAPASSKASMTASKKEKKMTDDDVKALLKKYYSDIDTVPQQSELSFELDTSDFSADEASKSEVETEPEVETEQELESELEVETEPEVEAEPEEEPEPEVETEPEEEPEPKDTCEEELDEILYSGLEEAHQPDLTDESEELFDYEGSDVNEPDAEPVDMSEASEDADNTLVESDSKTEPQKARTSLMNESGAAPIPVINEDDEVLEWKPSTDKSGRSDDSELDFMVSLGFGDKIRNKYGDERLRQAEDRLSLRLAKEDCEIDAYGYSGNEYSYESDISKIISKYSSDGKALCLRLIGTALLTLLIAIFENISLFGLSLGALTENKAINILLLILMLTGCSAFSYKKLWNSLRFSVGRYTNGDVLLPVAIVTVIVYDIVVAIYSPPYAVALYNSPVALVLLLGVIAEYCDFRREKKTFMHLSNEVEGELYALTELRTDRGVTTQLNAETVEFIDGFFGRNSARSRTYPMRMLLILIPLVAAGALLSVIAIVIGIPSGNSLGMFPAVFVFAAPLTWVFSRAWQLMLTASAAIKKKAGIIGGRMSKDISDSNCVVFDDTVAISSSNIKIHNIKFYDNEEVSKTVYYVNALFEASESSLSKVMCQMAVGAEEARSAVLTAASEHYLEVLVDGSVSVCAGSYSALTKRGIAIPKEETENIDAMLMYTAINGKASTRFCIEYSVDGEFLKTVKLLAADGIGVRIRTLDPNIDRAMLITLFGESANVGIKRIPKQKQQEGIPAVASVFARGDEKALAYALVKARRFLRMDRIMRKLGIVQLCFGAIAMMLLFFFSVPPIWLTVCAFGLQLLRACTAGLIYFIATR